MTRRLRPWTKAAPRSSRRRWPRASASTLDQIVDAAGIDGSILPLRVVGIAERTVPGRGGEAMLVGWNDAMGRLGVLGADAFAVRFDPRRRSRGNELTTTAALPRWTSYAGQIHGAIESELGRIFSLFDALALIAVIVAALGIVNTLTMNVIERVREIGVLRAAGMTRGQVWRSVVVEAGIVGLAGALVGVAAGLVVGFVMVVLGGGSLDVGDLAALVPWAIVVAAFVLGVTVAMLAAAYPARIASRISIIRAVQYE